VIQVLCDVQIPDWMTLDLVESLRSTMMSEKAGICLERDGGGHCDRETRISYDSNQMCIKGGIQLTAYFINDIVLTISRRRKTMRRRESDVGAMTI